MVNIIKEELPIEESLRKKLELICEFAKATPTIINGNIRKIDRTNLTYIEPNRIIIKDKTFLIFNYSNEVFIENLSNKIKLSELEDYLKTILKKGIMVNIIKEELPIEESLRKKLELICEFAKTTPTIINGNIRKIDRTNLTYIEPNRIIIKDKTFLIFNYSNEVFIENLSNKIKLSELEDYLKTN